MNLAFIRIQPHFSQEAKSIVCSSCPWLFQQCVFSTMESGISSTCMLLVQGTYFSHLLDTTGATLIRSICGTHMYMYKDSNNTCMHVHVCGCQQTYHQVLLSVNIPPPTQQDHSKLRQRCHHAKNSLSVKSIGRASCFHLLVW